MKECTLAVAALRKKAQSYLKLADLLSKLDRYAESYRPSAVRRPKMSAAGRARIRAAQKLRWAKYHALQRRKPSSAKKG